MQGRQKTLGVGRLTLTPLSAHVISFIHLLDFEFRVKGRGHMGVGRLTLTPLSGNVVPFMHHLDV